MSQDKWKICIKNHDAQSLEKSLFEEIHFKKLRKGKLLNMISYDILNMISVVSMVLPSLHENAFWTKSTPAWGTASSADLNIVFAREHCFCWYIDEAVRPASVNQLWLKKFKEFRPGRKKCRTLKTSFKDTQERKLRHMYWLRSFMLKIKSWLF